ncbi:unnamed protein product [Hapterophycus canaliculatus]
MYAFPDIPKKEVCRVARCSRVFQDTVRSAHEEVKREKARHPDNGVGGDFATSARNLIIIDQAKFFALGAQFLVIRKLCQQDLKFKTFYDLTGSGGRAGLAAIFLQHWSCVVSLEGSMTDYID